MLKTEEVAELLAKALEVYTHGQGDVGIAEHDMRLFIRLRDQIFAINIEERMQFRGLSDGKQVATEFMLCQPIVWRE